METTILIFQEFMKKLMISILISIAFFSGLLAKNKHSNITKYPACKGLVMTGYQGWFRAPKDGIMYPDENKLRIDMWPDISEYEKTYPTGLKLANGTTARFFSSDDQSTVDLHFKWMKHYGVDGVFMQRFFNAARPESRHNGATNVSLKLPERN